MLAEGFGLVAYTRPGRALALPECPGGIPGRHAGGQGVAGRGLAAYRITFLRLTDPLRRRPTSLSPTGVFTSIRPAKS